MNRPALLLFAIAACTDHVQLASDPLDGLVSLTISPADTSILITDLSQPQQSLQFHAIGKFLDGTKHDVTELVSWKVDNAYPGNFAGPGDYETSGQAAGHVIIHADGDTLATTAMLDVVITTSIVDTAFPPPQPDIFVPGAPVITGDPTRSPAIVYPSYGTAFPQGVASTLYQFTGGSGNDTFQLAFDCDVLHLAVLTGGDRWLATGTTQAVIAQSCIGGQVAVTLEAAAAADGTLYGANPIPLSYSDDRPDGIIYFWSAATSGIMRGSLEAASAAKLYPADTTCVGCHAVSRAGTELAMGYGGEVLQTISLPQLATGISAAVQKIPMGWASYSPDGTRLVVADHGVLTLHDAKTGLPIGPGGGKVPLPAMRFATHPDWSPDGKYVAVALTGVAPTNQDVSAASIARIPYAADTWGQTEVIVAATGSDNDYFPKYSPDGQWLAFVHATTAAHGAPDASLRLVAASGGTPIALVHATGAADTMPSWAPQQNERAWLAFASSRPYGIVVPGGGPSQIWIAAVDLAHAAMTGDPSAAAFWLPSQDVTVLNNNPIWSPSPTP